MTLAIPDFSRLRVLVAGDAMLDEYWFGDTARISPEAPVLVVRTRSAEQRPGGAANVALNFAALGVRTVLAAAVGDDERGAVLRSSLEQRGVRCELVRFGGAAYHSQAAGPRPQPAADSARCGAVARAVRRGARRACSRSSAGTDVVVLSDYAKGTLARVTELIAACNKAGVPVLVDPKGTDFARYRGVHALTPNRGEFEAVVGRCADEADLLRKGEALRAELGLRALLVTRGEQGMTLFTDGEPLTLPAQAREVFDVTGAGDTVIALFGGRHRGGLDAADAAALANLGAGIVVGKIGVATVSRSELQHALHSQGSGGRGLVELPELVALVAEAKARGERVVMTNGCFDILHAGHVSYLEEAKSCGDRLIVAVNDDASVRRLKGRVAPDHAARGPDGRARGARGRRLGGARSAKTRRRS